MTAMEAALAMAAKNNSNLATMIQEADENRRKKEEFRKHKAQAAEARRIIREREAAEKAAKEKEAAEKAEAERLEKISREIMSKKMWGVTAHPCGQYTLDTGIVFADTEEEAFKEVVSGLKETYPGIDIEGTLDKVRIRIFEIKATSPFLRLSYYWE